MNQSVEPTSVDVVILGGGMVGMSLACALGGAGISVALVDRDPWQVRLAPQFDGRVSAIAHGSRRILEGIGAWGGMRDHAQPIHDIRVSDRDSPFFLHYDHHEVGEEPFGHIVENRVIRHALCARIEQLSHVRVMAPAHGVAFNAGPGEVTVSLANGQTLWARLLVGAEGKNSPTRRAAGIQSIEYRYEHSAIVCTIEHTLPHHGLAQERFLPAGPFAVLPMQGNRSSLVWTEHHDDMAMFMALPDDELAQEIRERTGDYLGEIRVAGPRFHYPLAVMHAQHYAAARLALIGDAAHAIHPIAGQGVNLGFRDVAVLAELVADTFRLGLDIGASDVLRHYERWRRFDNLTMLAVTDGLNRLFTHEVPPLAGMRRMGLWAVGQMPPLKRFFMRHAMGMVGDLPRLARGEAL